MSSSNFSKNDFRYWEKRVSQPTYQDAGETRATGNYTVRIQAHGERRNVSLDQTKKRDAAKAALKLYKLVKANGWERGLDEFRGERPAPRSGLTLGEWLSEVTASGLISPRTLKVYATKVRLIASEVGRIKLPQGMTKHDRVNGGAQEWRRRTEAVPLDSLTTKAIHEWRRKRLAEQRENPAKLQSTVTSTNSCLRAGKAIFADRILRHLKHLSLPSPVPFAEIETTKEKPTRYRTEIPDPEALLVAGVRELSQCTWESEWEATWKKFDEPGPAPEPHPQHRTNAEHAARRKREAFKILILGLCAGLRRGEIDRLQWSQVDLAGQLIRIEVTDCFAPKANSTGDIPVDDEIVRLLKEWKSSSSSRFVVNGVEPRHSPDSFHYRCNRSHRELIRWLKSKGITARNPLHSLRKEYGSIVCAKAGIYVASRLLRHANISMTAAVYVDDRARVTPGLGAAFVMESA